MADTQITGTLSADEAISSSLTANEGINAGLTPNDEVSGALEVKRTQEIVQAVWGTITGTLSDQTDLQTELDKKVLTKTKAQYDALPSSEKEDPDSIYFVPDYEDDSKTWVALDDTTTANDKVWSSSKISSELGGVAQIDDTTTSQTKAWSSTKISTEIDGKLSYSVNDDTATDIADADFVPYYDYSAAARKKSTWANIIAKIKAKLATVATTGSYNDLSNKPSIPAAQIQSDWNQTSTTAKDFIKNKPTIPAAQVNSDWNSSSGVSQILNKPTLATVATSGSYSDLVDEPTNQSAQEYSSTVSLCTRHEKYTWNSAYNNMVKWFVSTGFTGATSISIAIGVLSDYGLSGAIVSMLADNGTNKPVKWETAEIIVGSGSVPDSIYITFTALEHDTTFKIGLL